MADPGSKHRPASKRKRSSSSHTPERDGSSSSSSPPSYSYDVRRIRHHHHQQRSFDSNMSLVSCLSSPSRTTSSSSSSSSPSPFQASSPSPPGLANTPSPPRNPRERSPEPSPISFRYPQTPTGKKRARQTNVSLFNDLILTNNNNNNHNHNHNHNNNNHNHNHNNRGSRPSSFGGGGLFGIAERGSSLHSPSTTPTSSPSSCQKSSPCAFLGPSAENEFLSREDRRSFYLIDCPHDVSQLGSNRFQEDFESLKMLEKGDNGEVYLVCHRITGVRYAIKKSTKNNRWKSVNCPYIYDYNQTTFGEARALSALEHKNIIQYFFSWVEDRHLYLQLEYCSGGSLEGLVRGRKVRTERLKEIGRQISGALEYLGGLGLVHCDVKPSNILITSHHQQHQQHCLHHHLFLPNGEEEERRLCEQEEENHHQQQEFIYKLSDFGTLQKEREVDLLVDDVEVGSGAYLPSVLSSLDPSVDIFSLGITLFELSCEGRVQKID